MGCPIGREEAIRLGSLLASPIVAIPKLLLLTHRLIRVSSLRRQVDNVAITVDSRSWRSQDVRRALIGQIGLAFLEIIPLFGSCMRQIDDRSCSGWHLKWRFKKVERGDIIFGFKATRALLAADQLFQAVHQIRTREEPLPQNPRSAPVLQPANSGETNSVSLLSWSETAQIGSSVDNPDSPEMTSARSLESVFEGDHNPEALIHRVFPGSARGLAATDQAVLQVQSCPNSPLAGSLT